MHCSDGDGHQINIQLFNLIVRSDNETVIYGPTNDFEKEKKNVFEHICFNTLSKRLFIY